MMQATPVRQKPVIVIYYKTVTKCIKREASMHKRDIENVMQILYFVFKTGTKWYSLLYIVFLLLYCTCKKCICVVYYNQIKT